MEANSVVKTASRRYTDTPVPRPGPLTAHTCTDTPVQRPGPLTAHTCTDTPIHRCRASSPERRTLAPIHRYTSRTRPGPYRVQTADARMHRYTGTVPRAWNGAHLHRYTGIPVPHPWPRAARVRTDTPINRYRAPGSKGARSHPRTARARVTPIHRSHAPNGARTHRYTDTLVLRPRPRTANVRTDTPIHRCTGTAPHVRTDTPTHRDRAPLPEWRRFARTHRYTVTASPGP